VRGQQPATLGMAWLNSSVHCLSFMWCYYSVVFLLSAYLSFYTDALCMGIHVKYTDQHFYFVYNFILISLFCPLFIPLAITHPASCSVDEWSLSLGGEGVGSGVEQRGHEADHSPPPNAEFTSD